MLEINCTLELLTMSVQFQFYEYFLPDIETDARKSQNCRVFINECENYLAAPGTFENSKSEQFLRSCDNN